ncbi:hypothetical protein AVEN_249305-1 [Araneus ventricosus]|uniref:Uncharacterized protein n=1 Tax=Araneus ventricosus TaxID=182803 RepID=A0A4Y2NWC2_ARAVE|nr:hypothetical protein AVEN_249305-1 [Araneus ventricosus]
MNTDEESIVKRRLMTKKSKMISEAKPGISEQDSCSRYAYRRYIEAETPARRERCAEAYHLVPDRQRQRIREEAIHFIEA